MRNSLEIKVKNICAMNVFITLWPTEGDSWFRFHSRAWKVAGKAQNALRDLKH